MAIPVKIASCWGVQKSLKSQIPSTKLQTNLKFQYSMTKTILGFRILVIVICLLFEICDLEFLLLQQTAETGKEYGIPLRGQPNAGSSDPGFFTQKVGPRLVG
jgi:hypothetical protein